MSNTPEYLALIRQLVGQYQPHTLLQVGIGSPESTVDICACLDTDAGAMLTLVDPDLHESRDGKTLLAGLRARDLQTSVEGVASPIDQALPDFYFQEQVYDMAIFSALADEEINQVALYYLGRLLPRGAVLVVNGAASSVILPQLRKRVLSGEYRVHAASAASPERPFLEKMLRKRYQKLPGWVRAAVEDMVRPELITPDSELGLGGAVLVLEKMSPGSTANLDVEKMIAELV